MHQRRKRLVLVASAVVLAFAVATGLLATASAVVQAAPATTFPLQVTAGGPYVGMAGVSLPLGATPIGRLNAVGLICSTPSQMMVSTGGSFA